MTTVSVISLERRPDRRRRIATRLANAGLDPRWIDAVDSRAMCDVPPGMLTTPSHYACWLSHVRFLDATRNGDAPCAVVFEDDAVPSPRVRWGSLLDDLPRAMAELRLGYLQLGHVSHFFLGRSLLRRATQSLGHAVRSLRGRGETASIRLAGRRFRILLGASRPGTHGYAVTREFAAHVRHLNQPGWVAADGFYERLASALRHHASLRMGTLLPSLVEQESRLTRHDTIDSDVG